jgi:hypothetical protein
MNQANAGEDNSQDTDEARDIAAGFVSYWTFASAIPGGAAGYWADASSQVIKQQPGVLVNVAVAAISILAVTLAAMALLIGLARGLLGKVIEGSRGGIRGVFAPFFRVAVLSAIAAGAGFAGAMDGTSGATWGRAVLFGIAIWFVVWATVEAVKLVSVFIDYAEAGERIEPGGPSIN